MMKKLLGAALVCAAVGGVAQAGHKQSDNVGISGNQAWGGLGDARSSSNTVEYIGCQVISWSGSPALAYCTARDELGTFLSCSSSEPELVKAAQSLGPTGRITFIANKDGSCQILWTSNMSYDAPPVP